MIHDKSRLNQLFFTVLFKEEILDISDSVVLFKGNFLFFSKGSCLFQSLNLIKINAGIFLNGIGHGQSSKGAFQVNRSTLITDVKSSADLFRKVTEHGLGKLHHTVIVGICLIELHQSEFRVMTGVDSLITEHSSNLINSFHTADNQTL